MADYDKIAEELVGIMGDDGVLRNEPMAAHTTFGIGGPVDLLIRPSSIGQLSAAVRLLVNYEIPWKVIGCGSDLLISDEGLRGAVIEVGKRMASIDIAGSAVVAQAGAGNKQIAEAVCAAGLAGYEFASGIPGTVGGAAVMNAGAYGGEFKDVVEAVVCVDEAGKTIEMNHEQAKWSYRHSALDDGRHIVVQVRLRLHADEPAAIRARMDDLEARRAEKQPLDMPSAGSTFKRPEGYYVGALIQDCGLRGYRVGGAQVSEKHTGFVVNAGGATAADVRRLIGDVQDTVRERFDVNLEPEVRMWGFDDESVDDESKPLGEECM